MSGIIDTLTGSSARKAANEAGKAVDLFSELDVPSLSDTQAQLEELVQQGKLSPEQAEAILIERSNMEDVAADSDITDAQFQALSKIQDIVNSDGITAQTKARLSQIEDQAAQYEKGQREAIRQNMRRRGVDDSGTELAMLLDNQQGVADRKAQQDMDTAALAERQALEALAMQGDLSSNMRGQDFNEKASIAQAKDNIARFNAANRQNVNLENTRANNRAQEMNLSEKQRVADGNTQIRNNQELYNKGQVQNQYQNELEKRRAEAAARQGKSQVLQGQADRNAAFTGGILETGGKVAAGALAASDKDVKENISPSDLLDELTGYKYKYKRPQEHGEGDQVGIMAQDLEKVAPQAVEEDSEGVKRIDFSKLGGPILAALAEMNEKIKKIEEDE